MSGQNYSSTDDESLVKAARKGELAAFEELVFRHRDPIYARAFSMTRNEQDAVDLSQEAWIKGWQRLEQFQGDSSFTTWVTRIVINLCLDHLRKQKRHRADSIEELDEESGGVERQMPVVAVNPTAVLLSSSWVSMSGSGYPEKRLYRSRPFRFRQPDLSVPSSLTGRR